MAMLLLLAPLFSPASAGEPVAVELVLALDTSASVDSREFALQVDGLAQAFRDPEIVSAIENLRPLGAAIAVMQWGGPNDTRMVVPWTKVGSGRESRALAHVLSRMLRWQNSSVTSIRSAMTGGAALLATPEYEGARRIIDISGDGPDNASLDLESVRRAVEAQGITINGLAIESEDGALTGYYRDNVMAGPGCFVVTARDYADFARAIREKLLRELRPVQS
ncbi:MAG: DUF1194 domain-containing protein [Hyphomicrobiales bacterium]